MSENLETKRPASVDKGQRWLLDAGKGDERERIVESVTKQYGPGTVRFTSGTWIFEDKLLREHTFLGYAPGHAPSSPPNTGEAVRPKPAAGVRIRWNKAVEYTLFEYREEHDSWRGRTDSGQMGSFSKSMLADPMCEYIDAGSPATPTGPRSCDHIKCGASSVCLLPASKPAPVVAPLPLCQWKTAVQPYAGAPILAALCPRLVAHAKSPYCEAHIFEAMEARRKPAPAEKPASFHQSHQLLAGGVISLRDERGGR